MAEIYKYCDGIETKSATISLALGTTFYRQTTGYDGSIRTESYTPLTITSSRAPIDPSGLVVNYSFQSRRRIDAGDWSAWVTTNKIATIPQGQTSVTVEVPIEVHICYSEGITDAGTINYGGFPE